MTHLHLVPGTPTDAATPDTLVYGALADKKAGYPASTFSILSMTDFDMVLLYLLEWEAAAPSPAAIGDVFMRELITLAKAEQQQAGPRMTFGSVLCKLRLEQIALGDILRAWEHEGQFAATLRALLALPVDGEAPNALRVAFDYFLAELNIVFELHGLREKGAQRVVVPSADWLSHYDTVLMYADNLPALPRTFAVEASFVARVTGLPVRR